MRKFDSPDQVLHRYVRLQLELSSPREASGVLHSGLIYAQNCVAACWSKSELGTSTKPGTLAKEGKKPWMEKGRGKGLERTYVPACRRCNREWVVERGDLRSSQISASRRGGFDEKHTELTTLTKMLSRIPLWTLRLWTLHVLEPLGQFGKEAEQFFRPAHARDHWAPSGYELLCAGARLRWKRKHVSVPGGFFTPRSCRELVAEARALMEAKLRRAKLWDDEDAA